MCAWASAHSRENGAQQQQQSSRRSRSVAIAKAPFRPSVSTRQFIVFFVFHVVVSSNSGTSEVSMSKETMSYYFTKSSSESSLVSLFPALPLLRSKGKATNYPPSFFHPMEWEVNTFFTNRALFNKARRFTFIWNLERTPPQKTRTLLTFLAPGPQPQPIRLYFPRSKPMPHARARPQQQANIHTSHGRATRAATVLT